MSRLPAPIAYSILAMALLAASSPAWRIGQELTIDQLLSIRCSDTEGVPMPKEPKSGHSIELNGRSEEQPEDVERAQDPSSKQQDKEQGNKPEGQTKKPE